jgi:phosphate starvation-inducible PhoH-like protein
MLILFIINDFIMAERKLKTPIKKYTEHLTPEQNDAKKVIDAHALTIIDGRAGTGKTHLAVCYALEQLALNKIKQSDLDKIVITRATVMLKDHNNGFLPGDIQEKFNPWLQPIYDNMLQFFEAGKLELEKKINDGVIEIVPLCFLQGRTFLDSVIIVDETQNLTDMEVEMLFTRIGRGSKMILCGDMRQKITNGKSGLEALTYISQQCSDIGRVTLTQNFRDPIVDKLLELYDMYVRNNEYKTNRSTT